MWSNAARLMTMSNARSEVRVIEPNATRYSMNILYKMTLVLKYVCLSKGMDWNYMEHEVNTIPGSNTRTREKNPVCAGMCVFVN